MPKTIIEFSAEEQHELEIAKMVGVITTSFGNYNNISEAK
jgi:hypothetical protein